MPESEQFSKAKQKKRERKNNDNDKVKWQKQNPDGIPTYSVSQTREHIHTSSGYRARCAAQTQHEYKEKHNSFNKQK